MNEDVLLFIAIFGGLLIFGGGLFGFIYLATMRGIKPVEAAADRFFTLLKEEAYEQAYDTLFTQSFRDSTSPSVFADRVRSAGDLIKGWRWSRVDVVGEVAKLNGQITFADGQTARVQLTLIQVDEVWWVEALDFSSRGE